MRADVDRDERVAIAAGPRLALAGEADLGAVLDAGRQLDVERLAAAQRHALARERRGILEADLEPIGDVGALLRRPRAAEAAERPPPPPPPARPRRPPKMPSNRSEIALLVVAEVEVLAIGPAKAALRAAAAIAAAAAAEAEGHFRIALLVDLAPVILGAFVLVGQDVIGAA